MRHLIAEARHLVEAAWKKLTVDGGTMHEIQLPGGRSYTIVKRRSDYAVSGYSASGTQTWTANAKSLKQAKALAEKHRKSVSGAVRTARKRYGGMNLYK